MTRVLRRIRGFTLAEIMTAIVVVVVLGAIAVPMWRNHLLRVRRADAISALVAVQSAQDSFFGRNARYAGAAALTTAPPAGLGLSATSEHGHFQIELSTSDDALRYTAVARSRPQSQDGAGESADTRCAQMSIDHLGIRRATDAAGVDRSGDCWR
jgi:type IV pilus assembly protein PilE